MSDYLLVKQLGNGGTADVYLGADKRTGRRYAIKRYRSAREYESSKDEITFMQELEHPAIPKIKEILHEKEMISVVMEYVPGETLKQKILQMGRIPEKQVVEWGVELCDVLSYLHWKNILYRDLKPGNVIVTPANHLKLIDFGAAVKRIEQEETTRVEPKGTVGYAPLEQYSGGAGADSSSDIYALGATIHHMLTGVHPGKNPNQFEPVRAHGVKVSKELERILQKSLQNAPRDRYRFCEEIKQELMDMERSVRSCRMRVKRAEVFNFPCC